MAFSNNLRRLMAARGMSNAELGRHLGITGQAVSQWLTPGGTSPVGHRLERIAQVLGVPTSDLLAGQPGMSEDSATFLSSPGPPDEYDRLPDMAAALDDALAAQNIRIPARALTRHAQAALAEASRMDRRLPFEDRARLAAEAKAADLHRSLS
jgi:transcriptional regulator with XRE-family HTH domain